jgi:hypothetical protein
MVFNGLKLWTWIQPAKALDKPISEETDTWFNYYSIESNQVEAKKLLAPIRKENQKEYDSVPPNTNSINSIEFEVPRGNQYKTLNCTLQDSRSILITENGLVIRKKPLKYYLELYLEEYLALGRLKELIDR